MKKVLMPMVIMAFMSASCNSGSSDESSNGSVSNPATTVVTTEGDTNNNSDVATTSIRIADNSSNTTYTPGTLITWQWQLKGAVNTGYTVDVYDIDLFNSSSDFIKELQAKGKKVICYFSAGSYEAWREDKNQFNKAVLGNTLDGWPDEKWLDIRSDNVKTIMQSRLDLAKQKGCDAVEPDNVDGYTNNPGFPLTANDQLTFNRFIAAEAHKRHLAVGLKNDLDQVAALVDDFDFAVNEQCFEYDECDVLKAFIDKGKPVLNVEYTANMAEAEKKRNSLCAQSVAMKFSTLILPLDLDDSFRLSCL